MHDAEQRRVGADSKRERQDYDSSEAGASDEAAESVA